MKRVVSIMLVAMSIFSFICMPTSCGAPTNEGTPTSPQNTECAHDYESVVKDATYTEKGFTTHTCKKCGHSYVDSYTPALASVVLQYDDYVTSLGSVAVSSDATFSGDDCLEVITKDGTTYFHAKDTGVVTVTYGNVSEVVAITKARLHLVVVMGQSNAGCHFANAMSDVACDIGTAYWWETPLRPSDYTQTSMGFHTPLVAELRAQSVAAGSPEKPVLIWREGVTSKNGKAISAWATSKDDTSGTDDAIELINACTSYYTAPERADKYEIVESGMYWLQGEGGYDYALYKECFMAIWQRLKGAGINYCAFFRVRWGAHNNMSLEDRNDLIHHSVVRAQLEMVNENEDMYIASTVTENWIGKQDASISIDISNYITMMEYYGKSASYADSLGNKATFADGILTTTMKELYGANNWCHYGKFGYGIMGADAAYNMYRALHKDEFAIVFSDTSGMVDGQILSYAGDTVTLELSKIKDGLTFRPACFSTAGVLEISVENAGGLDITRTVMGNTQETYNTIPVANFIRYPGAKITVTYRTVSGESGSVEYKIAK